jgi:hypothetical protein
MVAKETDGSGKAIPVLSCDNYVAWKRSMKCELTLRELWEVIEPDVTTGIASHLTLAKKDAKAQALILVHVEESYQSKIEDMDSAKSMWCFLERLAKSRDRAIDLWRKFFTAKQESSDTAMQFVARVEARAQAAWLLSLYSPGMVLC